MKNKLKWSCDRIKSKKCVFFKIRGKISHEANTVQYFVSMYLFADFYLCVYIMSNCTK